MSIDAPHNPQNGIGCESCHAPELLADIQVQYEAAIAADPDNKDITVDNLLCLSCHSEPADPAYPEAPSAALHSSRKTGSTDWPAGWSAQCIDCHNPHIQEQKLWLDDADYPVPAEDLFVALGQISFYSYDQVNDVTVLTFSSLNYKPGSSWNGARLAAKNQVGRGGVIFPDLGNLRMSYMVHAVDEAQQTITVQGDASFVWYFTPPPTDFGILYGQLIKKEMPVYADPNDPDSILGESPVKFFDNSGPFSFADGTGEQDGICEVCHTRTIYHRYDSTGDQSHPAAVNCVSCHSKTDGFLALDCIGCHSTAQGSEAARRQVTGGSDFGRTSHHVSDGTVTEIVTQDDCIICHDSTNHQSNPDPQVKLNDPDGGESYLYDGTGASLENFCLNCHDADGPQQLFGDGNIPSDIATAWTTSSHNSVSTSELGNDACLACHGGLDSTRTGSVTDRNVHGASSFSLLSGLVAGESVANFEESLCYACHDGSPASTDIESLFAGTDTASSRSGANLNNHHDVSDADQAYSGAVIECMNCHDTHGADATDKVLADPDPGDGRIPAAGNSWPGSTVISEFCLDCHDNSYPASVTPPLNPMTDIYERWTLTGGGDKADQHGPANGSTQVSLRAGSGYSRGDILQCTDCHSVGHGDTYQNLYQLKTLIMSKDGMTPLTPDWTIDGEPYLVRVNDTSLGNTDPTTNGKAFCSTCHPKPMGGQKNAGCLTGNCHGHGSSSY
ncbi:hypothetical protein ACFL6N_07310 [Thermodesulfobacteriota bacterium]